MTVLENRTAGHYSDWLMQVYTFLQTIYAFLKGVNTKLNCRTKSLTLLFSDQTQANQKIEWYVL